MVDDKTVEFLDMFEDVHQNFYSKKKIVVQALSSNEIHEIDCYMLENFKPFLIENSENFLDNYDNSSAKIKYVKSSDIPDKAITLRDQVKFA